MATKLTYVEVARLLKYEPETGKLFWRERPREMFPCVWSFKVWNKKYAGKEAFTTASNGYHHGTIFNRPHKRNRVAWLLHHGSWPGNIIDHIDGDQSNDRPENLRDVSGSLNCRNMKKAKNNTSGFTGVCLDKRNGRWYAYIRLDGKMYNLGLHDTKESAVRARKDAQEGHGFSQRHGT